MLATLLVSLAAATAPVQVLLQDALPHGNDAARAYRYLRREAAHELEPRERRFFIAQVAANLAAKKALAPVMGSPLGLSLGELEREVIDYEAFKLKSYLTSGVFPKRYFGYFDERWDTAALERELKRVVHRAVALANEDAASQHQAVRITDAEVAVTFIAEGGALLLREHQAELTHIVPVQDVGMDDLVPLFARHVGLIKKLDRALGTHLGTVVDQSGALRPMSYPEALAAVAVLWLAEKERAAAMLERSGGGDLSRRSPDEQYVIGSLVYNSGILFRPSRVRMIRDFTTGRYLVLVSRENARTRWPLPVLARGPALADLIFRGGYPEQPTSWNAVYHVLQRYGAFVALRRFTNVFDAHGMFR